MIDRRQFLLRAGAFVAAASLPGCSASPFRAEKKKHRYVTSTVSANWNIPQDFSGIPIDKTIELPFRNRAIRANWDSKKAGYLCVVNDDGTNARRIRLPADFHSVTASKSGNQIYLLPHSFVPNYLLALDSDTLEVTNYREFPEKGSPVSLAGHGVILPGSGLLAASMNSNKAGHFDHIAFFDPDTLNEVHRISSYGFDIHEVRLTPDHKYFICGHYGSHLGRNPVYKGMSTYGYGDYSAPKAGDLLYPGSVTLVEINSGKRERLFSSYNNGQEGHAVADSQLRAYLPQNPPLLTSPSGILENIHYQEGKATPLAAGEFGPYPAIEGISIDYDSKYQEIIVVPRPVPVLYITDVNTQIVKKVDYSEQLAAANLSWAQKFQNSFVGGLAFHPDGKHYILSTQEGFLAFTRGTHTLNPAMSFPIKLLIESHLLVI